MLPSTIRVHEIDDSLQHEPSVVRVGSPLRTRLCEVWEQPLPHPLQLIRFGVHCGLRCAGTRIDRSWRADTRADASRVMIACPPLMPPSPPRPVQDGVHLRRNGQGYLPEESPNLATAESDRSPRWALNAVRLRAVGMETPFFDTAAASPIVIRSTASHACAHIASVIWRYQPVHARTS